MLHHVALCYRVVYNDAVRRELTLVQCSGSGRHFAMGARSRIHYTTYHTVIQDGNKKAPGQGEPRPGVLVLT